MKWQQYRPTKFLLQQNMVTNLSETMSSFTNQHLLQASVLHSEIDHD